MANFMWSVFICVEELSHITKVVFSGRKPEREQSVS